MGKAGTRENLAQKGEESDSNQARFEPALPHPCSSPQDARQGLKPTAHPHRREHFPLSVRAAQRADSSMMDRCQRAQRDSSVM